MAVIDALKLHRRMVGSPGTPGVKTRDHSGIVSAAWITEHVTQQALQM